MLRIFMEKTASLHQTSSFISTPLRICTKRHAQLSTYSRHFITTVSMDSLLSMRSEYGVDHEHQVGFITSGPALNREHKRADAWLPQSHTL